MGEYKRPPVPADVWTSEQVASYSQISERTLRDWRDRDATFPQQLDLPGRSLRWYGQDVVRWALSLRGEIAA